MVCSAVSAFPLAIHYLLLQTLACSLLLWVHTTSWRAASSITTKLCFPSPVVLCSSGFCSMLGGCPGSILLQLGQESGREECLEGVGMACGSPLPGLAGGVCVCVYCLPCAGEGRAVLPCVGSGLWTLLPSCLRSGGAWASWLRSLQW